MFVTCDSCFHLAGREQYVKEFGIKVKEIEEKTKWGEYVSGGETKTLHKQTIRAGAFLRMALCSNYFVL